MEDLLQNKLFLQYLSGASQDLLAGNPIGANVNAVTQQNIQSQNYMKLLQQLLGGGIPGSKLTADDKGVKFELPKGIFGQGMSQSTDQNLAPVAKPATSELNTNSNLMQMFGGSSNINPFVSSQPEITAADLAGLTPQDISSALGARFTAEQLGQKKASEIADMLYKQETLGIAKENLGLEKEKIGISREEVQRKRESDVLTFLEKMKPDKLDEVYPIPVPGKGKVSVREWEKLPDEYKRYALAASQYSAQDQEDFMSYEDWRNSTPTERERFLNAAMERPELMEAAERLAKAGAPVNVIETAVEKQKKLSQLKGQEYFNDPKWIEDLNKHIENTDFDNVPGRGVEYTTNLKKAKTKERVNYIESKIRASKGEIVDVKRQGKVGVWTVKWPSGDTEEISYAIYD